MKAYLITDGNLQLIDIDEKISQLVITMNNYGYKTYASCQGHCFPVDRLLPYIAFKAHEYLAANLEKALREDIMSPDGKLNWFWQVTGGFNSDYELVYTLAPYNPVKKFYRYWRKSLDQDFTTVKKLISGLHSERSAMPFSKK